MTSRIRVVGARVLAGGCRQNKKRSFDLQGRLQLPDSTKWGAKRAEDGHPARFPLTYVEVGNEEEFDKSAARSVIA
ncbi:MAG: hypothetical protein ACYCOR_08940 [Acidobacteriaceae bacterium]